MSRVAKGAAVVGLVLMLLFATAAAGGLYARFSDTNARRHNLQVFQAKVNEAALNDCLEIEKLKKGFRDQANQEFNRLDQTLALLNLKKTKAIVQRATADRDAKLRTYAQEACPRPVKAGGTK